MVLTISCSVIKDHPKHLLPYQNGDYMLTLKIITDDALMNNLRNVCLGVSSYDEWNLHAENGSYTLVNLLYRNIPSGSIKQLLENLHGIRGLRIIEVKHIHY